MMLRIEIGKYLTYHVTRQKLDENCFSHDFYCVITNYHKATLLFGGGGGSDVIYYNVFE